MNVQRWILVGLLHVSVCLITPLFSQCAVLILDEQSLTPVENVHVYYQDQIAVSDGYGKVTFPTDIDALRCSFSHVSFLDHEQIISCGDTVLLSSFSEQLMSVEVTATLSKNDRKKLLRLIRKLNKDLSPIEASGVAENVVFHENTLSEYKSFLFNYESNKQGIARLACVNAYNHLVQDSIRFFENPDALFTAVNLGTKRRQSNSWLHHFIYDNKSWTTNYHYKVDDMHYSSFSFSDQEFLIEYNTGRILSMTWVNPDRLMPLIELNQQMIDDKYATVRIEFDSVDTRKSHIANITGTIDIRDGYHTTHFYGGFTDSLVYREPSISLIENAREPFLKYLLLDVREPVTSITNSQLANRRQISEVVGTRERIPIVDMLRAYHVLALHDSLQLEEVEEWGEPIYLHRSPTLYLTDYYKLKPAVGVYLVAFENYVSDSIEINYVLDPLSTRFIQFVESDYNERWLTIQHDEVKQLNADLRQFIDSRNLREVAAGELSDKEWSSFRQALAEQTEDYLYMSLLRSHYDLKFAKHRYLRLQSY